VRVLDSTTFRGDVVVEGGETRREKRGTQRGAEEQRGVYSQTRIEGTEYRDRRKI